MGWFWNSGTNKDEEIIKNQISNINKVLTDLLKYLDHISSSGEYCSMQQVERYFAEIDRYMQEIQTVSRRLSTSVAAKIKVSWTDGRSLYLPELETCFQMVMEKISQDFECGKYINV